MVPTSGFLGLPEVFHVGILSRLTSVVAPRTPFSTITSLFLLNIGSGAIEGDAEAEGDTDGLADGLTLALAE